MNLQKNYKKINSLTFLTIVAHVIKKEKEFILAHPEYKISYFETLKIKYYLWKHKNGFPLAFITHHKEFFGLDFYVNKHTLVPRPETELLVEEVVQKIKNKELGIKKNIVLIDIGTGSGCIPIAIMKRLKHEKIKTSAIDISKKALKVARKNAAAHKVNIQFLSGNLLKPAFSVIKRSTLHNSHFTLIITGNLPYLTHEQFKTERSIQHEPYNALVAKKDGLGLYEELLEQIRQLLENCNLKLVTFFEIDPSQNKTITSLIKKSLPAAKITIKQDLAGKDRLVEINL